MDSPRNRVCQLLIVALYCVVAAGHATQAVPLPAVATNDWSRVAPAELRAARRERIDFGAAMNWYRRAAAQGDTRKQNGFIPLAISSKSVEFR